MRSEDPIRIPERLSDQEKNNLETGESLPLMEAFYTVQGEGYHTGKAAYFIRIGGCDVGCHWCDVKESWDAGIHPPTPIKDIVDQALVHPSKTIVITGGEPLMWDLRPLCKELKKHNFSIHIETSGAYPFQGEFDWICLSPKRRKPPVKEAYKLAHELKVIVFNKQDFQWAEEHKAKLNRNSVLFLQPEWSVREKRMPEIIEFVKENPDWMISLQTHKYMHIP